MCKKTLRNSVSVLRENKTTWLETCEKCNIYISAIINTLQQISCCQNAELNKTSLEQNFPDVKDALLIKLTLNCERAFEKLCEKKIVLLKCKKNIQAASQRACEAVNKVCTITDEVFEWSATEPSLCDIALWIESFSFLLNQSYAEKIDIFDRLSYIFTNLEENVNYQKQTKYIQSMWNDHESILNAGDEIFKYCFQFN